MSGVSIADPTLYGMKQRGKPDRRENFIRHAYGARNPENWDSEAESMLPEHLQDWSWLRDSSDCGRVPRSPGRSTTDCQLQLDHERAQVQQGLFGFALPPQDRAMPATSSSVLCMSGPRATMRTGRSISRRRLRVQRMGVSAGMSRALF
jgi:hypothetical protein